MESVGFFGYAIPFLIVLTIVIFFHELGHFLVARWNGVKVEAFSIGFGPELYARVDRHGTRWRLAAIPIGGYVKMFGHEDVATTVEGDISKMSKEEQAEAFQTKTLWQKSAIVFAGPLANYILAIVLFSGIAIFAGEPYIAATVAGVSEGSAAEAAGLEAGDEILGVDDSEITSFFDLQEIVAASGGKEVNFRIMRDGQEMMLPVTPELKDTESCFGKAKPSGVLGVNSQELEYKKVGPIQAVTSSVQQTIDYSAQTLCALGQIIFGTRGTEELGGPLRIAQISGKVAQYGITNILSFIAILSVNLGLINLFPIPVLDGGHLMFYGIEGVVRKPLNKRIHETISFAGFGLILALMLFVTWNDLVHLKVFDYLKTFFS
jgi:regulator of sigma E protease